MLHDYQYLVDEKNLRVFAEAKRWPEVFEALASPLHEALYKEQDFALLEKLTTTEQLILSFDYVRTQVSQGGFIQLFQNGYARLLVVVIEALQALGWTPEMISVLDDALRVAVLNKDSLLRDTDPAGFAKLYAEYTEFEELERRFNALQAALMQAVAAYVLA